VVGQFPGFAQGVVGRGVTVLPSGLVRECEETHRAVVSLPGFLRAILVERSSVGSLFDLERRLLSLLLALELGRLWSRHHRNAPRQ
jgi:hypothetical protein